MQAVGNRTTSNPTKAIVNGLAIFGALSAAALLVMAVILGSAALSGYFRPSGVATTESDQLSAGAITFRAGERADAPAAVGDPLTAPALIEFRNSEHADSAAQVGSDPLTAPALIEFRNSEHSEAP